MITCTLTATVVTPEERNARVDLAFPIISCCSIDGYDHDSYSSDDDDGDKLRQSAEGGIQAGIIIDIELGQRLKLTENP